jgi:hypothetical protein
MSITRFPGRALAVCSAIVLGVAVAVAQVPTTTTVGEIDGPHLRNFCPGNVVTNPGFDVNTVIIGDGSMPPSTTQAWTRAYGSPQLQGGDGCNDPDYISMWGNQYTGEAVQQPVTFHAGRTYAISFCARFHPELGKVPTFVNIVLRASNATLTSPACPAVGCETITTTANISSITWNTYTACWTPARDESILTVSPTNNSNANEGTQMSWGQVDDICIREVKPPVIDGPKDKCTAPATYCVKQPATGPYHWSATGGTATPVSADGSCAIITWTSGGVGSVSVTSTVGGCTVTSTMQVAPCDRHMCDPSCDAFRARLADDSMHGGGEELTFNLGTAPAVSVKATILSASRTSSGGCAPAGPIAATVAQTQAASPTGWNPPVVPFLHGNQVIWKSNSPGGNALGPFKIDVDLPGTGSTDCNDRVTVCIEFEVDFISNGRCHTCTYVQCYTFDRCPKCQ